jgi:hypothetical protein
MSIKLMNNMPNKNKKMHNYAKCAKICKIKLHTLNHGVLKYISLSSSIKYNIARLIYKFINL